MKRTTIPFQRVDGGQFDSIEAGQVPANGWARAFNFLSYNRRMNRRGGSGPFSIGAAPGGFSPIALVPVRGLKNASDDLADWAMVVAAREGQFALVHGTGTWEGLIPQDVGGTIGTSEIPWTLEIRNGRVYAQRALAGRMKRIEADGWTEAGRPAPSSAPVKDSDNVAGGSMVDGIYLVSYTFYDSDTGYEGNESPTLTVTLANGGAAQLFTIDTFESPTTAFRATHYGIYMTRVDGSVKFLVERIPVASTTYIVLAEPSGEQLDTQNGQPPDDATWHALWNERSWWISDEGRQLLYSSFEKIESSNALLAVTFDPDDGDTLNVVFPWGKYMVVAKNHKMLLFTGYDRATWEKDVWTNTSGCVAPHSMRNGDGTLIWLGEDGFLSATPDSKPGLISNDTVKALMALVDKTRRHLAFAEIFPRRNLYICVVPLRDGTWSGVAYNWETKAWSTLSFASQPRSLRLGFDADGTTRFYACTNGVNQVYVLFEGDTDNGAAIPGELLSGALRPDGASSGDLMGTIAIGLLAKATRYPVSMAVYGEGDLVNPIHSASFRLQNEAGWNWAGLSTRDDLRTELQYKIAYDGRGDFWVSETAVDMLVTNARRAYA